MNEDKIVRIYTDGACSGNPGPGGWGAILTYGRLTKELSGGEKLTTNNKMELTAVIKALQALKRRSVVEVYSDSTYVIKGITQWVSGWQRRGWKRAGGKLENADLWQHLAKLKQDHQISWHWVKGHAGHPMNERADRLAVNGIPH